MSKQKDKKVYKKFTSFNEEEQWLQSMLQDGWLLKKYSIEDEDDCRYVFEPAQEEEKQNIVFKVDFREFNRKREFEEYKDIFADTGWNLLSENKWYSKHIFYTASTNAQQDIFSDTDSFKDREKRKMTSSLTSFIISFALFLASVPLFIIFVQGAIFGAGFMLFIAGVKNLFDYYKHRKAYKSLVNNE
ncbi:DUF2812 domain-containing protein [Neobacillus mesonae]|nr:DUF2812 domain-containing protein [Neobacillus mesonae]